MMISEIKAELRSFSSTEKATQLQRFFKTGPGEYGESDIFIGVSNPNVQKVAKRYYKIIKLSDCQKLLESKVHEDRMLCLQILVNKYPKASTNDQTAIYEFYLKNTKYINNWDLVDVSVVKTFGRYLFDKDRSILYKLAVSKNLWEKRISIMATFYFIRQLDFADTLKISEILLNDTHDLIHKAVGWMLREIGNRHRPTEEIFLKQHYKTMPRTMLRYAIEKFPEELRQGYLKGTI